MDMPFELILFQKGKSFVVPFWKKDEAQGEGLKQGEPIELVENSDISLQFRSMNKESRFYMEGLEMLSEELVREDEEGHLYLSPSEEVILLCSFDAFPFSPDEYFLHVKTGGTVYISYIRIVPGRLTVTQMQVMRDELEQELSGLTMELNFHGGGGSSEGKGPWFYWFYGIIEKQGSSLLTALHEIERHPHFSLEKAYQRRPMEKAGRMDGRSFRDLLTHPGKKEFVLVPVPIMDYDTPKNRWLKSVVQQLLTSVSLFIDLLVEREGILRKSIKELEMYAPSLDFIKKKQSVCELESMKKVANQLRQGLVRIQQLYWFKEISAVNGAPLSSVWMQEGKYRTFYEVYRTLEGECPRSVRWKATGKLYEMWCFLLLIRQLCGERLGFQKVSGVLTGEDSQGIPDLEAGTRFLLEKGKVKLALTFDEPLPRRSRETDPHTHPLYTSGSHNRPDARLDVFFQEVYCGSLLIDFKYRNSFSIWDESLVHSDVRTREMTQLITYGFNSRSIHLYGEEKYRFVDPVQEVWVFYPKRVRSNREVYFPDYKLNLLEVSPGMENNHLENRLQQVIESIIHRAKENSQ